MSKYNIELTPEPPVIEAKPEQAVALPVAELKVAKQPTPWGLYSFMAMQSIVLVVVLVLVLRKDDSPSPEPVPPRPAVVISENVEQITASAERKFIKNKADAARRLAADIDAGKVTNSQQFGTMAIAYQEAIEKDAFAEMIALNQKYVRESADEWTPEQKKAIKELQSRKAAGYEGMLK